MKKFFTVIVALGLCMAVTMPAAAAVSVTGDVGFNLRYESRGQDSPLSVTLNNNDYENFEIEPQVEKAYMKFDWDVGPANPYIQIGMKEFKYDRVNNGDNVNKDQVRLIFGTDYTSETGTWGGNWEVERRWMDDRDFALSYNTTTTWEDTFYDADIWWQVNPMLKLSFGKFKVTGGAKGVEKIGPYATTDKDWLARAELGLPFGKLTVDFVNPKQKGTQTFAGAGGAYNAAEEENLMPGIGISLNSKIGPVQISPNYQTQSFNYERATGKPAALQAAAGADDSFTAWAAQIPVKVNVGPVGIEAAYAWGENIGEIYTKDAPKVTVSVNSATPNWEDNKYKGWAIIARMSAGIGKLSVGYAYDEADMYNKGLPRMETERDAFSIEYAIPIGKGFTITPQYVKINDGETKTGGVVNPATDDNTRKIYTVNFNVRF